ncbi:MAG: hypothetical protein H7238_10090 [Polaromonas sp.]|nr:hypothetical protein [Polaromonas sp.]
MNRATRPDHTATRWAAYSASLSTRHLRNACLACGAIVFTSVAAAAVVLTDNEPLMVGAL